MVQIPWPLTNNPGLKPQEGTGRLINVFPEPRGDGTSVWRRVPGASVFARAPSSGSISLDFDANARGATFFSTYFEFVGSSTYQFAGPTTVAITYPDGTAANDLVVVQTFIHDQSTVWTAPSGFTTLAESSTSAATPYSLYYKVSTGETTASLVPPCTAGAGVSLVYVIRGGSTAPIVDTASVSTGGSGDPKPSSMTCTTADSLIVTCAWQDDDNASAVSAPSTCIVSAATTFGCGGTLFSPTTGADGTAGGTVMVAFRPKATTGNIDFSTGGNAWVVTNGDDEWAAYSFTMRHD